MIVSACSSCGNQPADTTAATPADSLRTILSAAAEKGYVIIGHHDDPVYGHNWAWEEGRSDIFEVCGDYPGAMSWDIGMIEMADSLNLDSVPFSRMRAEIVAQDARGGINTISWHLRNPVTLTDSWDISDTTIVSRTLNDSVASERFDTMLSAAADFINSLRRPDGSKVPVVFRPWHEHTGSWFWWGRNLCSADDYKALWKRTREAFDKAGVDNVLWAYSPDRVADAETYMERYPGDGYVDIMGIDIYHFGGEDGVDTYRRATDTGLSIAAGLAAEHGKIMAFSETGSESLPMERWWDEVLLPLLRTHHPAYAVVWRNAHDKPTHYYGPYPGDHTVESFKVFYNDTVTAFASDMKEIR